MRKPPKKQKELKPGTRSIRLPKDALNKVNLGHSFAEYDPILLKPNVFVETPAIAAARDEARAKCFFVGRRGTGKTGTTYFLENRQPDRTIRLLPQISAYKALFNLEELGDLRRQPFKSLVSSFKRALQDEVLSEWLKRNVTTYQDLNTNLTIECEYVEYLDFDERVMAFVEDLFGHLRIKNSRDWVRQSKRTNEITREMSKLAGPYGWDFIVLIDRIDEAWDGSDEAVILLMALMHACVELNASDKCIRPLLFLRENIFERVRAIDNEFSRLETSVVSMDWTRQQLLEMIERRLNLPFNTT